MKLKFKQRSIRDIKNRKTVGVQYLEYFNFHDGSMNRIKVCLRENSFKSDLQALFPDRKWHGFDWDAGIFLYEGEPEYLCIIKLFKRCLAQYNAQHNK